MKFDKLLHPEVLLGKRGDRLFAQYYRENVHTIRFTPERGGGMITNEQVKNLNRSEQRALGLMQRFRLDNGKVFHVNRDFLLALAQVERKVALNYLPERFVGYISFADGTIFDESDEIEGAYVYIGPSMHTNLSKTEESDRVFWCAYICKGYGAIGTVCTPIREGGTVEDLIAQVESDNISKNQLYLRPDNGTLTARAAVFNVALNSVMYVHSAEPDVKRIPSQETLSHSKRSQIEAETGIKNACTLPITFLNWNYAKQRIYSVESTWVNSFPRWQPCGPRWSQIKLVWVREHPRNYKTKTPV